MSTTPGETKNIVDALRRALQGPVSTMASGGVTSGGSFTVSLQPSSFQAPGGSIQNFQSTVDVASVGGFNGTVTLTEVDTLTAAGGAVAFLSTTLTSVSTITVQVSSPSPAGDGLASLNILVAATTPQGSYTVTVTGTSLNNGVSQTASAILTIVVGAGTTKCVNDKDCGTGCSCLNGLCDCLIDNTLLGCGPTVATGTGSNPCNTTKWTQLCSGEGVGPPFTNNGCCYCGPKKSSDCAQYTAACQAKYGPNSVSQYVCSAAGCGCFCSQPTSKPPPSNFTLICPVSPIICIDPSNQAAQMAVTSLTVANGTPNAYNVTMTVNPTGINCTCCGAGPSLSTGGGYQSGAGTTRITTITIPVTCTTAQCYQWNLKISVADPTTNSIITTFSCQLQVCTRVGGCFQVLVSPDGGCPVNCTCAYSGSGTPLCTAGLTGVGCTNGAAQHCGAAPRCTGCSSICLTSLTTFQFALKSIGGYAGAVNWKVTSGCQIPGSCGTASGQQILLSGQTVVVATHQPGCLPFMPFNIDAAGVEVFVFASPQVTLQASDGVISSSGTGICNEAEGSCA